MDEIIENMVDEKVSSASFEEKIRKYIRDRYKNNQQKLECAEKIINILCRWILNYDLCAKDFRIKNNDKMNNKWYILKLTK